MSTEEQKLKLDTDRFKFEQSKFEWSKEHDERRFKSEAKGRAWSQAATVIPLLVIILGFYLNVILESIKSENLAAASLKQEKRVFINKQLSEFYYPIKLRLDKDTAIWRISEQLSGANKSKPGAEFSKNIENKFLIPNHQAIIKIIDENFILIKNPYESFDPKDFIQAIGMYQRHVAVYSALRESANYGLNPIEVCDECKFPNIFPELVNKRIAELEAQRSALDD